MGSKKLLFLLCASAALLVLPPAAARAEESGLGVSVPVFVAQMKAASTGTKHFFPAKRLEREMIRTSDGDYVAEYNDAITLFLNTFDGTKMLKNAALSLTLGFASSQEKRADAVKYSDEEFEGICRQVIIAADSSIGQTEARRILRKIGLYGPVLDGKQRRHRRKDLVFLMKLQGGVIMLAVSGI